MDGGAWWAAVHGVAKSRTRPSDFTFTFHFHALEKEMATHSSVLAWRIPGMGEPGGLPSTGSHRVGHDWSDLAAAAAALSYMMVFIKSCETCLWAGMPDFCWRTSLPNAMAPCEPPLLRFFLLLAPSNKNWLNCWSARHCAKPFNALSHSMLAVTLWSRCYNPNITMWKWGLREIKKCSQGHEKSNVVERRCNDW